MKIKNRSATRSGNRRRGRNRWGRGVVVKSVVRSALENHNTVNKNSNEVYFVSKQACAKRARERERERKREREIGRGKHVKNSKNSNQRGVLRFQASLCKASEKERERGREGDASMTRIEINEVYFVSKHVKNSNLRGVLCFNQRVVLCLQAGQEFQSTRCTSSPRCTWSLVGDGGSVKNVKEF